MSCSFFIELVVFGVLREVLVIHHFTATSLASKLAKRSGFYAVTTVAKLAWRILLQSNFVNVRRGTSVGARQGDNTNAKQFLSIVCQSLALGKQPRHVYAPAPNRRGH